MAEFREELENLNLTISTLTEKMDQVLKTVKLINSKTEKTKKTKKNRQKSYLTKQLSLLESITQNLP